MIYSKTSISIRLVAVISLTIFLFLFFQTNLIASDQTYRISESFLNDVFNLGHIQFQEGNLIGALIHFQYIGITLSRIGWPVKDSSFKNELNEFIDYLSVEVYTKYEEGLASNRKKVRQYKELSESKGEVRLSIPHLRRNLPLR